MSETTVRPDDKNRAFVSAYPAAFYFSAEVISQLGSMAPAVSVSVRDGEEIRFSFEEGGDWAVSYTDTDRPAGSISGTTPITKAAGIKDDIGDSSKRFSEVEIDGSTVVVDASEVA